MLDCTWPSFHIILYYYEEKQKQILIKNEGKIQCSSLKTFFFVSMVLCFQKLLQSSKLILINKSFMNNKTSKNSTPVYLQTSDIKQNSVIILTGASSGLGRQMALKLAQMNVLLVIVGRNRQRLQSTKKQCLKFLVAKVQSVQADLTQQSACKSLVQRVLNKFGRIDVLILNAGINAHFLFAQLKDLSIFEKLMKTNFYANVYLTKFALASLRKTQGFIVVISSLSGKFGLPDRSAYCASKFALNGFFQSLRTEQQKISICMVYPTSLDTPMRNNDVLGAKPTSHDSKNKQQSADTAAELIIGGIKKGQKDIYIPGKYKFGVILQPMFPGFMRNKVKQAAKL